MDTLPAEVRDKLEGARTLLDQWDASVPSSDDYHDLDLDLDLDRDLDRDPLQPQQQLNWAIEAEETIRVAARGDHAVLLRPDHARALRTLSRAQLTHNTNEGALLSAREAANMYRTLLESVKTAEEGHVHQLGLKASLISLVRALSSLGQHEAALLVVHEVRGIEADMHRLGALSDTAVAWSHVRLGGILVALGKRDEAATAYEDAVALLVKVSNTDPAITATKRVKHRRARLGSELGVLLMGLSRPSDALVAVEQSIKLHRELIVAHPGDFAIGPVLAPLLIQLSLVHIQLEMHESACKTIHEAIVLRRDMVNRGNRHLATTATAAADLADDLSLLAREMAHLNEHEAAIKLLREAEQLAREHDEYRPTATSVNEVEEEEEEDEPDHEPDHEQHAQQRQRRPPKVHRILIAISESENALGRHEASLRTILEGIRYLRTVLASNSRTTTPALLHDLATALSYLAVRHGALKQFPWMVIALQESIELRRNLIAYDPIEGAFELAVSLRQSADALDQTQRRSDAMKARVEATGLLRSLVARSHRVDMDRQMLYNVQLTDVLCVLGHQQGTFGLNEDAAKSLSEAAHVLGTVLIHRNPDQFVPQLAGVLNLLSTFQRRVGDLERSLASATEAVRLYTKLVQENPRSRLRPELATAHRSLAVQQAENGLHDVALASAITSIRIFEGLENEQPGVFMHELVKLRQLIKALVAHKENTSENSWLLPPSAAAAAAAKSVGDKSKDNL